MKRKRAELTTKAEREDAAFHAAQPREKQYKLAASKGVYLIVRPNGSKYWRLDVRRNGINTTLSLGMFPQTSLASAIAERDVIRAQARIGINPAAARRAAREASTLGHAGAAFKVSMSSSGELSIGVADQTLHLSRHQTDAIRSVLLADR